MHDDLRAVGAKQLRLSALVAALEERVPLALELGSVRIELREGMTDEHGGRRSQKGEGGGIRVEAHSLVVENQDAIEGVLVDGSEFTLRSVDTLAAHIPGANVEKRSASEGEQDGGEGGDGKIGGI